MARLASSIVVGGLLRAAEAAGGNGAVLEKGNPDAGAIMLVLTSRGVDPVMMERVSTIDGKLTWNQTRKRGESLAMRMVSRLIDEKKRFDRDLWVLELDIPNVQQFIVDSLGRT